MKRNALSTAMPGLLLSLAALILSPVSNLKADIFTIITDGPGGESGPSYSPAWGDYDSDGFIDLFIPNNPVGGGLAFHFLYHNNGDGTFSRITTGVISRVFSYGRGAAWADYDNDGNLDLVLVNVAASNNLFRNNGDGTFGVVNTSFTPDSVNSPGATWVDYDIDGYLDLFRSTLNDPLQRLHRNNRDGTFTRITAGAFLSTPGTRIASTWADYNNDGRPDLFLPSVLEEDGVPNYLWRNDGGGTFTRVGAPVLAIPIPQPRRGVTATMTATSICSWPARTTAPNQAGPTYFTAITATARSRASPLCRPTTRMITAAARMAANGAITTMTAGSICSSPTLKSSATLQ